LNYTRELAFSL